MIDSSRARIQGPANQPGNTARDRSRIRALRAGALVLAGLCSAPDVAAQTPVGALAIDSRQGNAHGWAVDYASGKAAREAALRECGSDCSVVLTFERCGAYAADQDDDSTAVGWARSYASVAAARRAALAECAARGGSGCIVRAWGCNGPVVEEGLGLDRAARRQIQFGLQAAGFDPGPADGLFGPRTRAAIRRWQEARQLQATGYLDAAAASGLGVDDAAQAVAEPPVADARVTSAGEAQLGGDPPQQGDVPTALRRLARALGARDGGDSSGGESNEQPPLVGRLVRALGLREGGAMNATTAAEATQAPPREAPSRPASDEVPATAPAERLVGALALGWSPELGFGSGFALDVSSAEAARELAVARCARGWTAECSVVAEFEHCAAFTYDSAYSKEGSRVIRSRIVGWATGRNETDVRQRAAASCTERGGGRCRNDLAFGMRNDTYSACNSPGLDRAEGPSATK